MAYTPAPPIDMSKVNFGQFNPNLQQTAAPTPPPYSGTTSGYQPSNPTPAYNGTTSGYRPSAPATPATPAPPTPTAAPTPQPAPQGTPYQAQKVSGGWMTADGQFVPVPNATATPAPPRPQEPPNYQFQPMPQTAAPQMQQPTAAPVYKDPYARTPESIAALAKERVQKILQAGKTSAQGALTGAKNAYDYTNQIEGDTRTLRNAQFKETSNPFSGNTGYQAANMQRNDSIQDTSQDKDYNAQVGLINQKLADLEAAAPGDEQAIIDQLQQIERQTGISVAQLQEQQKQNQFSNNMQTNQFNRGVYESDRGYGRGVLESDRNFGQNQQNINFNQGVAEAGLTGQYRGQETVQQKQNQVANSIGLAGVTGYYNPSGMSASQINQEIAKNSAAWANATPEQQKQLHARNVELNGLLGKTDSTGSGDYVGGNPNGSVGQRTVAGQQLDFNQGMQVKQFDRGNFESDRSYELAKSGQEWSQLLQKDTFDLNKAQTIWENNFKDKGFQQSVEEAAASRGLQWATLGQRDKEFIADQAFRDKSFEADQTQRGIDNSLKAAKSGAGAELTKELEGLYTGLSSGQITPYAANAEIDGRVKVGLTTPEEAARMKTFIQNYAEQSQPVTKETGMKLQVSDNKDLTSLSDSELADAWESDPTGKQAGRAKYDWRSWVKDSKGYKAGLSYELWHNQYGPKYGQ